MKPDWIKEIAERPSQPCRTEQEFVAQFDQIVNKDIPRLVSALNKAYELIGAFPCQCLQSLVYDEHTGEPSPPYTCVRCQTLEAINQEGK